MPIRVEMRARYPKSWPEISRRIRFERAGNRCECRGECGVDHAAEYIFGIGLGFRRCLATNGTPHPITGSNVVLTVAHLDHIPEHAGDDNLRAMCQRCHNRYDMPMRRAGIAARQREAARQGDLFRARQSERTP